jgi:hypothetical protein
MSAVTFSSGEQKTPSLDQQTMGGGVRHAKLEKFTLPQPRGGGNDTTA